MNVTGIYASLAFVVWLQSLARLAISSCCAAKAASASRNPSLAACVGGCLSEAEAFLDPGHGPFL